MSLVRASWVLAIVLSVHRIALAADPTTADCLNANDRSIALRNKHLLRAARAEMLVCAAPTCPEDIRNECARRVGDVNSAMPTIVFEVRDRNDNDLSAVAVSVDGQPLVPRLEGTALSIDPGEHSFVFSAHDAEPVHKRLLIREGEKGRREKIIVGLELPAPTPKAQAPLGPQPTAPLVGLESPKREDGSSRKPQRILGIAVGSVGIIGAGVAVGEQLMAKGRETKSRKAAMSPDPAVRATTRPLYRQAEQAQTYAIVLGAVSAAAIGTGLYLLISSLNDDEPSRPSIGVHVVPSVEHAAVGMTYTRSF